MRWLQFTLFALGFASVTAFPIQGRAESARNEQLARETAREILEQLIVINTAPSGGAGQTRVAAELMARRLLAAGFPAADVQVLGLTPTDGNLVARYRSAVPSRRPVLLMAHLDVVEAEATEWSTDPFRLVEKDGYWYGRGTRDNKFGVAMLVANFIRLKQERFRPDRDLIILLTADEEGTGANLEWLLKEHRPMLDAAFALNTDGGLVSLRAGRPEAFMFQTAEKTYADFAFEAHSPGGHSSQPLPGNAIYQVAAALERLRDYRFPRDLSETTQVFFKRWAALAPRELQPAARALGDGRLDDPSIASLDTVSYLWPMIRTTCVATRITGGHADNALPETARSLVNCRVLPQSSVDDVESVLNTLANRTGTSVQRLTWTPAGPPSPLDPEVLGPVEQLAAKFWPGVPVLPQLSPGASDGAFTRKEGIPTYGVAAVADDPDDDRFHAANERIGVRAFYTALEFWYRLSRRLSGG